MVRPPLILLLGLSLTSDAFSFARSSDSASPLAVSTAAWHGAPVASAGETAETAGGPFGVILPDPSPAVTYTSEAPGPAQATPRNVRALVAVVRGLNPIVCGLTAEAVSGWGGRSWMNAPATPLGPETAERVASFPRGRMTLSEISLLIDSLGSGDPCVREVAVRLIGRAPASLVAARLLERVAPARPVPMREAAVLSLGLVRARDAVNPLLRFVRDGEVGVRANVVWALGRIGDRTAAAPIRQALRDEEDVVRDAGAGALGSLEDQDSIDELLTVVRTDRVARVRRTAAWALGSLEARRAADGLAQALRTEREPEVREMMAWALGEIEDAQSVGILVDVLRRDGNEDVRETAAWALGQIESTTAAAALGEAAGGDAHSDVRATAAWALGQLELREAPAGLLRAVTDREEEVRTRAAWALSEIGDARAVSALRTAFRAETNTTARKAQLRALVRSGERSEEFFRELLRSEDPDVREAAVRGMAGRGNQHPWPWPMPRPRPFP